MSDMWDAYAMDLRLLVPLLVLALVCGASVFGYGFEALVFRRAELEPGEEVLEGLFIALGVATMLLSTAAMCGFFCTPL